MSKADYKEHSILEVEWQDAGSVDEWRDIDGIHFVPVIVKSVGYLLHDSEFFIVIALSIADDEMVSQTLQVPRSCIIGIREL